MLNDSHVRPNLGNTKRVIGITLKRDPATIRSRFELMARGILINSHRHFAAILNSGKLPIGGCRCLVARSHSERKENDCNDVPHGDPRH
jgi:hypothetical protein